MCKCFCIGMEGTRHYHCVRGNCLHEHLAMWPSLVLWEHVRQVRGVIARYLQGVPNNCLRFEENKVGIVTRQGFNGDGDEDKDQSVAGMGSIFTLPSSPLPHCGVYPCLHRHFSVPSWGKIPTPTSFY